MQLYTYALKNREVKAVRLIILLSPPDPTFKVQGGGGGGGNAPPPPPPPRVTRKKGYQNWLFCSCLTLRGRAREEQASKTSQFN